jgi:hypothetical protein
MKKQICTFFIFCVSLPFYCQSTSFNGTIEYKLTEDVGDVEFHSGHVPTGISLYFSEGNVAEVFRDETSVLSTYLFKDKQKDLIVLSDSTYTKVQLDEKVRVKIVKLDETLSILGHTCQKYKVSVSDPVYNLGQYIHYVWAAEDMPVTTSVLLQIYGNDLFLTELPFAFLKIENLFGLHYEAVSVESKTLDPDLFKIPKGYKKAKNILRKLDR